MRLKSIGLVLPERLITNDYVVGQIEHYSKHTFCGDIRLLSRSIFRLLQKSGAKTRYWSVPQRIPINYTADAVNTAINNSAIVRKDIELVIYAGVDRGFFEPANAYFLADYIGIHSAQCFDIVDACNGWSRALQVC